MAVVTEFNVTEHEGVRAAAGRLATLQAQRDEAHAAVVRGRQAFSPYRIVDGPDPVLTRGDRLRMLAATEDDERALNLIEADVADAESALARATALAREEFRVVLHERYHAAVAKLDASLTAAVRANAAVAELDDVAHHVLGTAAPRYSWHELRAASAVEDSRLDAWRRFAREHGVL